MRSRQCNREMIPEKLAAILRANFGLTGDELKTLTEAEGWAMVYSQQRPPAKKALSVYFTGFDPIKRAGLRAEAARAGIQVKNDVTRILSLLCIGEDADPEKLRAADRLGIPSVTEEQFRQLLKVTDLD